jgi:hypothetical protein
MFDMINAFLNHKNTINMDFYCAINKNLIFLNQDLIIDVSKRNSECIDGKPNGTMSSCEDVVFGDEGSAA